MRRIRYSVFVLFLLLAGCGLLPAPALTPEQIVAKTADKLKGVAGFHFAITVTGTPVYLDTNKTIGFNKADGNFVAPNQVSATVKVTAMGMVAEIKILGIGDKFWQTNPLSGQWAESPAGQGFNPAVLFDPQTGLQKILLEDLTDVKLTGTEELKELPGKKLDVITAKLKGEHIKNLTSGLISADQMDIKLWIDPQSFEPDRFLVTVPVNGSDQPTTWQIDFWDFGKTVTINPPASQ